MRHDFYNGHQLRSITDVMNRASDYLGIGVSTLYSLWKEWVDNMGTTLPHSSYESIYPGRMKYINSDWTGPIRAEVMNPFKAINLLSYIRFGVSEVRKVEQ